jgi:hypothetical protein
MEVWVVAIVCETAGTACSAWPVVGRGRAQQPGRQIHGKGGLADPVRPDQEHGLRRPTADHRGDRAERGRLSPGPGAVHARGQAGSAGAVFRVERRFGVAGAAPVSAAVTSAVAVVDALAAAGLRAARGLAGALATGSLTPASAPAAWAEAPAGDTSLGAAAGVRVARGARGLAAFSPAAPSAAASRVTRGFRVAVGFAAALAAVPPASTSAAPDETAGVVACAALLGAGAGLPTGGFCATCARSIASSSGGTSLHGSFELRGTGAGTGRSLLRL